MNEEQEKSVKLWAGDFILIAPLYLAEVGKVFFSKMFILERGRERERQSTSREGQREGEAESEAGSRLRAEPSS